MDVASFMSSFTGILTVAMTLSIPVVAIVAVMIVILTMARNRNRERMKMIEQGILPPPPKKKTGHYYHLLVWGAILFAFGLAMTIAELVAHSGSITAGLVFGLIGLALLVCFLVIRARGRGNAAAPADPA